MDLTPIKVRGKRSAKGEAPLVTLAKRPKHSGEGKRKQAKVRCPRASNIEKSLPLEVLERIFWFSENLNFPRASPRLGALLSGTSTLRETFLSAFGPTWDVWFGCIVGRGKDLPAVHSYTGWQNDAIHFGGNPSFQTDILACSWVTIDVILDCWDMWVRRHAQNHTFEYIPLWGTPIVPSTYKESSHTVGVSRIKEARYYFYNDYHAFQNVEGVCTLSQAVPFRMERDVYTWIQVHTFTEIPDSLITGPWDEGSLQKFFWLVQAGARLSPSQTWEVTLEGFQNALADKSVPNMTVIRLFNILGAFKDWPKYVKENEFDKIDAIMPSFQTQLNTYLHAKYTYIEWLLINETSG